MIVCVCVDGWCSMLVSCVVLRLVSLAHCRASIAQWLEHWSSKPGVGSSILPGGSAFALTLNWDHVQVV